MIQPIPYIGQPATLPLIAISTEKQIRTRNGFDEQSLRELAATIEQVGIIEPIIVRRSAVQDDQYIVIAGERRLLAASLAGLTEVPTIIRDADATAHAVVQAIENLQRVDLSLADTAEGVALLVKEQKGVKAVARLLGKSPAWVSKHASIAKVSGAVRDLLAEGLSQDPELLLGLDQIARCKAEGALNVFAKLANGLSDGTTNRANVRAALVKLKTSENLTRAADDDGTGDENQAEGADPQQPEDKERFGKIELSEEAAKKMLAALKFAQEKKPSSRPGEHLIAYVEDFIRKTWK